MTDPISANPADSLAEERQAAARLLELLKQEQSLLVDAKVEGLNELTEQKAQVVARMTDLALLRHRRLGAAGFEARESGMQEWLKSAAKDPAAARFWSELLGLAQAAKELNRTNGVLINRQMTRNRNALAALQGGTQQAPNNFYGPTGQATGKLTTRGLVIG